MLNAPEHRPPAHLLQQPPPEAVERPLVSRPQRAGLSQEAIASLSIETTSGGSRLPVHLGLSCGFRYRDDAHRHLAGPSDLVNEIRRRTTQVTQVVDWLSSGDAYIIDNHRIAHGRTAITNPDRIGMRILAYSPEQTGATQL